jgi:hypothetical protein
MSGMIVDPPEKVNCSLSVCLSARPPVTLFAYLFVFYFATINTLHLPQ